MNQFFPLFVANELQFVVFSCIDWFLFVMSLGLSVATEIVLTAGVQGAISDFPSP
jgi:hypothetical protein